MTHFLSIFINSSCTIAKAPFTVLYVIAVFFFSFMDYTLLMSLSIHSLSCIFLVIMIHVPGKKRSPLATQNSHSVAFSQPLLT